MASLGVRGLSRTRLIPKHHYICAQCRQYAAPTPSTLPAPPMLLKLRTDLKTAMKQKDTTRLNVLRALINDVTNSAKSNNPVKTDMQILSLLRKRQAAAKQASSEFKSAGREDLVEQEEGQAQILEEYAGDVETVSSDDIREVVIKVVEDAKAEQPAGKVNMGDILKKLLAPGGNLDGKPVEKSEVAKIVKEVLTMS